MGKYFKNINTLEELRKQYKELLKKHHPDNGGNVSDMQEINAEYNRLFKILKDRHDTKHTNSKDNDSNSNSSYDNMKYDFTEDVKLREMLSKIITFHDITIEIVGAWIWISGNTYKYKKELKELGFKWASNKKMWFWHSEAYRKKSHKILSMDEIRSYYGSTKVQTNTKILLEA